MFLFVKQKPAYELRMSDWSSDVCSSDLAVLDLGQTNRLLSRNSTSITLTVPRATLDRCCPGIERLHAVRIGGGGPRLLADHLLSLYRNLPAMSEAEAGSIGSATLALVGACLAPSLERIEESRGLNAQTMHDSARRTIAGRHADQRRPPTAS